MKCTLCDETIDKYDPKFHHLNINESRSVDICSECMDKVVKWQSSIYANLFPTKALKKRFGKN